MDMATREVRTECSNPFTTVITVLLQFYKLFARIFSSVNHTDELSSSFDNSWKRFSAAWKTARAKASEKSIHDLRVNTRRLIAALDLARALSKRDEIAELQRHFRKVLKRMGPLRDLQVQLENIAHLRQIGVIADYRKTLERRERRKIDNAS